MPQVTGRRGARSGNLGGKTMVICLIYSMYVVRKTKEERPIPQFLSQANRKNKGVKGERAGLKEI